MRIMMGALLISLAAIFCCLVLLFTRNPRRSKWGSDALIGNFYCPLLVSFGVMGIALFISGVCNSADYGITHQDFLIAAAILGLTAIGLKALKIKKRLADYETQAPGRRPKGEAQGVHLPTSARVLERS
jgi:O-antigen ligase